MSTVKIEKKFINHLTCNVKSVKNFIGVPISVLNRGRYFIGTPLSNAKVDKNIIRRRSVL